MFFGALVVVVDQVVGAEELRAGVALEREEVEAVARGVGAVAAKIGELHLGRKAASDWAQWAGLLLEPEISKNLDLLGGSGCHANANSALHSSLGLDAVCR